MPNAKKFELVVPISLSVYDVGDCIGGLIRLPFNVPRHQCGLLQSITLYDYAQVSPDLSFYLFDGHPGFDVADNDPFAIPEAATDKLIIAGTSTTFETLDESAFSYTSFATVLSLFGVPFFDLYLYMKLASAPDFSSVTDFRLKAIATF